LITTLSRSIRRKPITSPPEGTDLLNLVCFNRGARGPMAEPGDASRPWTLADDDKLRKLATTGLRSRAIGIRMNRTETAVRLRARQLQVILRKSRLEQLQMG
jgi:hypothetical protein